MNKSESINELATALCKAQAAIKGAVEDSTNPHFKSKYASLQSYLDAAREPLFKNGLAVTQLLSDLNCEAMKMVTIETILMHSSGQWVSSIFSVPVSKQDAQGFGSAITYARRYAFAAVVGIAPIDDDGNAATDAAPAKADKAKNLPVSIVRGIENAKTIEDLMAFAGEQKEYHKNQSFRQMVASRKEALA